MEKIASALKRAMEIREDSWDGEHKIYNMSLFNACKQASQENGDYDINEIRLTFILLEYAEDEVLEWAEKVLIENR